MKKFVNAVSKFDSIGFAILIFKVRSTGERRIFVEDLAKSRIARTNLHDNELRL